MSSQVLIAGGGPVGLFAALLLGRYGVEVIVFDENAGLQKDPRAATTHPGTLEILNVDGLVDDMTRVGLVARVFQFWDRPSGNKIAEFDHALLSGDTDFPYVIQCEQFKTAELILQRLHAMPNVEVLFGHAVTDLSQDEDSVSVSVTTSRGPEIFRGAYLIGDGVRGGLYGEYPSLDPNDWLYGEDLSHTIDFRSIYSTVLDQWLGVDPTEIVGGSFEQIHPYREPIGVG